MTETYRTYPDLVSSPLRIKDQVNTETLLKQVNMLSVNKINAQVKLMEVWKAIYLSKSPLNIELPIQDYGAVVYMSRITRDYLKSLTML